MTGKATKSGSTRWLVAFDDESLPDEGMYETSFGAVVGKAPESSKSKTRLATKTGSKRVKNPKRVSGSHSTRSSGATPSVSPSTAKNKNHDVSTKESPAVMVSSEDSNQPIEGKRNKKKRKATSSTSEDPQPEQEQEQQEASDSSETKNKAAAARAARRLRRQALVEEEHSKRMLYQDTHPASKKAKTGDNNKDENVVKVPMLTGTLFLYRGARPRAEFVFKK